MQKMKKRLIIYLCLLVALCISGCNRDEASLQSENIRRAQREVDLLKKELEFDSRFSELIILADADDLVKYIIIEGSVPDRRSLDFLESLIRKKNLTDFNVRYSVRIEEDYRREIEEFVKRAKEKGSKLSEKELRISKIISYYFLNGFSVEIKGPMRIEEVEKELFGGPLKSDDDDILKKTNSKFIAYYNHFKSQYQYGDEIYYFISDKRSWDALGGRSGYVLIRNENIITVLITEMS